MTPGVRQGRHARWSGVMLLSALLAGCGAAEEPGGAGLPCDAITLERTEAEPLEPVAVHGVPEPALEAVRIEARVPGGAAIATVPHVLEPELAFLAPGHPAGVGGGPLEVRVRTPAAACPFVELVALPLEPAPAAVGEVVAALEELVHDRAARFGVSPEALATANPNQLPDPAIPLALAQTIIRHPANGASLHRTLGEAPPGDPLMALLGAVWARDSLARRVRRLGGDAARHARTLPTPGRGSAARLASRRPRGSAPAAGRIGQPVGAVRLLGAGRRLQDPDYGDIWAWDLCGVGDMAAFRKPSAEQLDCMMRRAVSAGFASSGEAKETFQYFQSVLGFAEVLAKLAGAGPLAKGYKLVNKAGSAYMTAAEALSAILPSELVHIEVAASPVGFLEDEPGPGSISTMTVTARSEGWNLESWIAGQVAKKAVKGNAPTPVGAELRSAGKALESRVPDGRVREIPAMDFGPTDISDPEWSDVKIIGGAVQLLGHTVYAPRLVGDATLTVRNKPIGFQVLDVEIPLGVEPIRVAVTPTRITVQPGDRVTLRATVENARDRTVVWDVTPAGHQLHAERGGRIATLLTSSDPALFPIRVRATSDADRSHLRQVKPRVAQARVRLARIDVRPAGLCLRPGQRQQFEADVPDMDVGGVILPGAASGVEWRASVGRIDDAGRYVAPEQAGEVTITARSPDHPDLEGEAVIRVGGCSCWMVGSIGRPLHRLVGGVAHLEPGGGLLPPGVRVTGDILSLTNDPGFGADPGEPILSVRVEVPGLSGGGTGPFDIRHAWAESAGEFTAMIDPSAPGTGRGVVEVTDRSDGAIEGVLRGWLTVFSEGGERLDHRESYRTPVRLRFRAVTGSRSDRESDWFRCLTDAAGLGP